MAAKVALPDVGGISQTALLLGAIIAGFLIYLAFANRLGIYWSILTGGTGAVAQPTSTATAPTNPAANPTQQYDPATGTPLPWSTPPADASQAAPSTTQPQATQPQTTTPSTAPSYGLNLGRMLPGTQLVSPMFNFLTGH